MAGFRELAQFCHKMENALRAGIDVQRAFLMLSEESAGKLSQSIKHTAQQLGTGRPLHSAMRKDERIYTPELVNAVYVTEQTGHMETAFGRMALQFEARESTRRKLMQAMLYPCIVLIVFVIALLVVASVWHVLPQALFIVGVIVLSIAGMIILRYGGEELGKSSAVFGNVLIRMPLIGRLVLQSELADFADNMSVFYSCGVEVSGALEYSARSLSYKLLRDKVLKAAAWVKKGNPLSEALSLQGIFPADLIHMLQSGEASGNVDGMLSKVAEYYRSDVQYRVDMMMKLLRQ